MQIRQLVIGLLMVLGAIGSIFALDSMLEDREASKHKEYNGSVAPE